MSEIEGLVTRIADLLVDGRVIPFLGAGANLCDRPDGVPYEPGRFLPSGGELAHKLAEFGKYPSPNDSDLSRVSQYVDATLGSKELYRCLRDVFDADYPPTSLHLLLARLPARLRDREKPQLVVLTTNYDDLMERALSDEDEPFDVVWYEAKTKDPAHGRFLHRPPDGKGVPIDRPNKYRGLALAERPTILKLHGAIDRRQAGPGRDSYVVTEDDYIEYLAVGDVGQQIPFSLRERMADSHFLFLGYSMHDWNLRVILSRIWGAQQLSLKSWAVQREPTNPAVRQVEEVLWRNRGDVELHYVPLCDFLRGLEAELGVVTAAVP